MTGRAGRWVRSGRRRHGRPTPGERSAPCPRSPGGAGPPAGGGSRSRSTTAPTPRQRPGCCELLAARGVRATFFLIGERAARQPRRGARDQRTRDTRSATTPGGTGTRGSCRRSRRRGRSPRARASSRTSWATPAPVPASLGHRQRGRRWRRRAGSAWSRCSGPSSTRVSARAPRPLSSATSRTASTTARSSTFTTRRGCRARPSGFSPRCPASSTSLDARGYAAVPVGELLAGAASPR